LAAARRTVPQPVHREANAKRIRRWRRLRPHRIATLAFLTMAAAFFAVPLYVIVTTSFKTMDQIRLGRIFSLPDTWTLEAWRYAWFNACSGMNCDGVGIGFRKDDTQLRDAVQAALKALVADGTYQKILQKWNVTQGSLTTAAINGGS